MQRERDSNPCYDFTRKHDFQSCTISLSVISLSTFNVRFRNKVTTICKICKRFSHSCNITSFLRAKFENIAATLPYICLKLIKPKNKMKTIMCSRYNCALDRAKALLTCMAIMSIMSLLSSCSTNQTCFGISHKKVYNPNMMYTKRAALPATKSHNQ
jgi:hypothetical protein